MAVINSPTLGKHRADITGLDNGGDVEVTSEDITDSTATGRAVLTAADPGAARTAIGAGTGDSDVALVASGGNNGSADTAARSDHTHAGLLSGSASSVADAIDENDVVDQLNALLGVLRTRGVLSS